MAGFSYAANEHLVRSNIWSNQIKEPLLADLYAMRFVDQITDFGDGDTFNIPSVGQMSTYDFVEGQAVRYTAMDTGNLTFTINNYKASGTYITERMKQDSFYMSRLVSMFAPKQHRAIMTAIENDVLSLAPLSQTASSLNTINGGWHRFVGSGTNQVIGIKDFAIARYALQKANVPMTDLVAIVDPSVEYTLSTTANLVALANNPRWEGVARDAMSTGFKFMFNVYGFDVYVSQFLKSGISETVNSVSVTNGVANLFFSAARDVTPFIFKMRQPPRVESKRNIDLQRDEYVTTCRWGSKVYRPENLVVCLTDNSRVS